MIRLSKRFERIGPRSPASTAMTFGASSPPYGRNKDWTVDRSFRSPGNRQRQESGRERRPDNKQPTRLAAAGRRYHHERPLVNAGVRPYLRFESWERQEENSDMPHRITRERMLEVIRELPKELREVVSGNSASCIGGSLHSSKSRLCSAGLVISPCLGCRSGLYPTAAASGNCRIESPYQRRRG